VATQTADVVSGEAMTTSGGALLPIENAGDDGVGIVDCKTAYRRRRATAVSGASDTHLC
jgi:hypothetical protein